MLQQETNRFRTGIKAMVVVPVLALLIFTFAERVYTQELPPPPKAPKEQKMPEEIKSLSVITPKGKAVAVLTYKNGKTVKADISSAEKQAAFKSKYGVEILPPPPPPKAPKEQKMPEEIKRVSVIAPKGKAVAVLNYKNGKTVKADISSVEKQSAFESKYGVEIPPPPPPAIVPATREAPAASASPVIFVATASEALTDPKQQYKFVAEPVPAAAVKERVTPPRRTAAKQPPGLVPAGDTQIREVRRSEDIQVPVKIKIPAVDRAAAD